MVGKRKAAPRKRSVKPEPPAEEPQEEISEPEPVKGQGPEVPLPFEPEAAEEVHTTPEYPPTEAVPADGTLLRKDGDPVVYVMDEGQRRPFADLEAFHACCGGGATIIVLSPEEIDPIPQGPEVNSPEDLQ